MGFGMLSRIPTYQMPSPPRSREQSPARSPVRSQIPTSPLTKRKILSQLPQAPNRKHHLPGLPEPEAKRPTLVARAGEFPSKNQPAPTSYQSVNHAVTTTAIAGPSRFSASTSTKPSPPRGRSITSFSASVGPSARPQNNTTSTLPRPAMPTGRIPRQTRPATNTTAIGTQNARQRPAALPTGMSSAGIGATTSNRDGSAKAPIAKGKPIFPPFLKPAIASAFKHCNTHDVPRIGERATSFCSKPITVSPLPKCITGDRNVSITSAMQGLRLESSSSSDLSNKEGSPSKLPRPVTPAPALFSAPLSVPKSRQKHPPKLIHFLTRDSNTTAWDPDQYWASMERVMSEGLGKFQQTAQEGYGMKDMLETYKNQCIQLEKDHVKEVELLNRTHEDLRSQLEKDHIKEVELLNRTHEDLRSQSEKDHIKEVELLNRTNEDLRSHITTVSQASEASEHRLREKALKEEALQAKIDELERHRKYEERLSGEQLATIQALQAKIDFLERDRQSEERHSGEQLATIQALQAKIDFLDHDRKSEQKHSREQLATIQALQAKIDFLESDSKSQSEHYASMAREKEAAIATATEATEKLRKEETLRRQLHNIIQELKGNIRVFCRVRPTLSPDGSPSKRAQMTFPDPENSTQIELRGLDEQNSLGKDITKYHPFTFDRVFSTKSTNQEIFNEVSQLIQSSLDGYNVCIFAYGQTGSGKTYTMSAEDGIIPQALRMIYENTKTLQDRGWNYTMTGSFVEVYNETINDLLSKSNDTEKQKKKLEIKHDMQKSETNITNVTVVNLDSTEEVESILARAMAKRSVAATQANERSSRSHSVFMLTVTGTNIITGEESKGTLNLVDLAGSERLDQSKAEGARLKETQSINRSLSSLGDVIGALAQGKEGGHIPYRNSKLTNLLQFSLGGNSKTLMFCMVSPLKDHVAESLTTLRFAAKVNSTHIGRASKG